MVVVSFRRSQTTRSSKVRVETRMVVFDDAKMVPFSLLLNPKRIKTLNKETFFRKGEKSCKKYSFDESCVVDTRENFALSVSHTTTNPIIVCVVKKPTYQNNFLMTTTTTTLFLKRTKDDRLMMMMMNATRDENGCVR